MGTKSTSRPTFSELAVGDMFNTKVARWVKTSDTEAICVLSGIVQLGEVQIISDDIEIIPLYPSWVVGETLMEVR